MSVLGFTGYSYLRYVLLIQALAALAPAMRVKGRANDPFAHAAWWGIDQHSAVFVVCLAAIASSALVFWVTRRNLRTAWALVGCGLFAGDFPASFYRVLAPADAYVPLAEMYLDGTVYGLIAGAVLYFLLKAKKTGVAPSRDHS